MDSLPTEIVIEIISCSLPIHPTPSSILAVNSIWYSIAAPILHEHITFTSAYQLERFLYPIGPKSVKADITNTARVFGLLAQAFSVCSREKLQTVQLRVNSYRSSIQGLPNALVAINPKVFEWTSPEPDHQLTISIVHGAVAVLSIALESRWDRLSHLRLTNLSCEECSVFDSFKPPSPLSYIYIGQAVFVDVQSVIKAITRIRPQLVEMKLVDVYQDSIWGRRIRIGDLEEAWKAIQEPNADKDEWKDIERKVHCLVQRQRLDGGDKGEDMEQI